MNTSTATSRPTEPNAPSFLLAPEILDRIDARWHEDLRRFLASGDASPEFISCLETAPDCQAAVEEALRLEASEIPGLGRALAALAEESRNAPPPPASNRTPWLPLAMAASLLLALGAGFVAYQNAEIARSDQARLADLLAAEDSPAPSGGIDQLAERIARQEGTIAAQSSQIAGLERAFADVTAPASLHRITALERRNAKLARERDEARAELQASRLFLTQKPLPAPAPAHPVPAPDRMAGIEPQTERPGLAARPAAANESPRIIRVNMKRPEDLPGTVPWEIPVPARVDQQGRIQVSPADFPAAVPFDLRKELSLKVGQELVGPSRNGDSPEQVILQVKMFNNEPPGR